MFETVLLRRPSPFKTVETFWMSTSSISSGVTSSGPKLKKVSKLFERVRKRGFRRSISSAVMSSTVVNPATTEGASSYMTGQAMVIDGGVL